MCVKGRVYLRSSNTVFLVTALSPLPSDQLVIHIKMESVMLKPFMFFYFVWSAAPYVSMSLKSAARSAKTLHAVTASTHIFGIIMQSISMRGDS